MLVSRNLLRTAPCLYQTNALIYTNNIQTSSSCRPPFCGTISDAESLSHEQVQTDASNFTKKLRVLDLEVVKNIQKELKSVHSPGMVGSFDVESVATLLWSTHHDGPPILGFYSRDYLLNTITHIQRTFCTDENSCCDERYMPSANCISVPVSIYKARMRSYIDGNLCLSIAFRASSLYGSTALLQTNNPSGDNSSIEDSQLQAGTMHGQVLYTPFYSNVKASNFNEYSC